MVLQHHAIFGNQLPTQQTSHHAPALIATCTLTLQNVYLCAGLERKLLLLHGFPQTTARSLYEPEGNTTQPIPCLLLHVCSVTISSMAQAGKSGFGAAEGRDA